MPADFTEQFNTHLSPKMEEDFQAWLAKSGKAKDLYNYDLRGAFKAGQVGGDDRGHLTDAYKKPNHPTFSSESIYSNPQMPGGEWAQQQDGKWVFKASPFNLKMYNPAALEDYFKTVEPDSVLLLPQLVQ